MAVPITPSAARDIADLSLSTFSYPWQLPPSIASLFLLPAINSSLMSLSPAKSCSAVSTTPAINLSLVSTPAITENPWQVLIAGVVDTGDKFFAGVVDTAKQLFAGVVDTGDREYLREFPKKFKTAPKEYLWAWGTLIHEKT